MIFAKRNYEIHDQKLLIIIDNFKHWKNYLKNSSKFVEILINHNNLKKFMNTQILNERQTQWIIKLIFFNFIINHKSKKINFVDASSKRFDYYDEKNTELHKLLSILQKKLKMIEIFRVVLTSKCYVICASIKHSVNLSFNVKNEILKFENDIYKSIELSKKKTIDYKRCWTICFSLYCFDYSDKKKCV